jgi:predicted RNA-binding protein YlqC (UPF0109 family)
MKELVEYVVKSLVDHPDEVEVHAEDYANDMLLELSVAGDDMGRVIGKKGRVINAIRTLAKVSAAKQGKTVSVELLEADER